MARAFTSSSMDRLAALQGQLPESASDELGTAGRTLTDLDTEISTACGLCDGALTTTPDFLRSSAPIDLVSGLDADELTLEAAPLSGQDVSGITIPQALQSPAGVLPQPSLSPVVPTKTPGTKVPETTKPDPTKVDPTKVDPTKPVKDITKGVTDTTSNLANQLDEVTGGAIGGLTGAANDATGGLIGEVTGTVDGVTGGALGNATGGLLP